MFPVDNRKAKVISRLRLAKSKCEMILCIGLPYLPLAHGGRWNARPPAEIPKSRNPIDTDPHVPEMRRKQFRSLPRPPLETYSE